MLINPIAMKKTLLFLFLLSFSLLAQVTDDFSDGDFTNNPTWSGTTDSYVVNDGVEVGFGNKIPLWLFGFLY